MHKSGDHIKILPCFIQTCLDEPVGTGNMWEHFLARPSVGVLEGNGCASVQAML